MNGADFNDNTVKTVVCEVIERLKKEFAKKHSLSNANLIGLNKKKGIFDNVDSAVSASKIAQIKLVNDLSLRERSKVIDAMRACTRKHVVELSELAVAETGLGRVEDKIKKNILCADKTPGIEILTSICKTGDDGLTLIERAPFGVIASVTPCTNATETIINNAIGMVAGGNSVVFNVHPSAKKVAQFFIDLICCFIEDAGGPSNLVTMISDPTIETSEMLMRHISVGLVVVTGGPGVVGAAMKSGKRAICGGPGNPPVVVDETADIAGAGKNIVLGASFDNNIICVDEKEVICVDDIADLLKKEMCSNGAVEISGSDVGRLENLVFSKSHLNKEWVGKDAFKIAKAIGKNVPSDTRILLCEVDDESHPFIQTEMLMPVLPIIRMRNVDECIAAAVRCEHGYRHTAGMYSTNINSLHNMARAMNCSIFVKNAFHCAGLGYGGEGYTSFTIASPTGEGLTTATSFTRERRCTLKDYFRIV